MGVTVPDKLYYKIGEVAQMAEVRTSVLRFWETEFEFLRPEKSTKGQRLYTRREVDLVLQVRRMLYEDKFTIEGVKKRMSPKGKLLVTDEPSSSLNPDERLMLLRSVKEDLESLRSRL